MRQFQKNKPKSDNFYGSLFTMREAEDRVRERRERDYSSLVRSPEPGRVIDSKKAQRLINQGRVSLTYPSDNSKGSPRSKLSPAGQTPKFTQLSTTLTSTLHLRTLHLRRRSDPKERARDLGSDFLSLPPSPSPIPSTNRNLHLVLGLPKSQFTCSDLSQLVTWAI